MSDEKETTNVEETPVTETAEVTESTESQPESSTESTDQEQSEPDFNSMSASEKFSYLGSRRMCNFKVTMTREDLKFIKNTLTGKVEWKGPNEAYLLIISFISIDGVLQHLDQKNAKQPVEFELSSAAIESISHFLTRVTGKGVESAQRLFAISMLLRPAMEKIRSLDTQIEQVKSELKSKKSEENSDK